MAGSVKVSNISKHVDSAILQKLFSFLGAVERLDLHQSPINPEVQEAIVEFTDTTSVKVATFLSGTEIADKALIVTEHVDTSSNTGTVAAIAAAAAATARANQVAAGMLNQPTATALPLPAAATATNAMVGTAHSMPLANPSVVAMMATRPRNLNAIPANVAAIIHPSILQFDPVKAEEISRTIYVGNIASSVNEQQLMDFFNICGPVAYVKMAGDGMQPTRFAFIEFADIATAQAALQMNGMMLADRPLKVNHSKNAINKPQRNTVVAAAGGLLQGISHPGVPGLAATASLPSSVDPVAVSLFAGNANVQARLQQQQQQQQQQQAGTQQPGVGLAWPVLGNTNPLSGTASAAANSTNSVAAQAISPSAAAAAASAGDEDVMMRQLDELRVRMEDKYRDRSRRRDRDHSPSRHRSSTHRERSPAAYSHRAEDEGRRGESRHRRSRSRGRRSPSSRRRESSRDRHDEDDYYRRSSARRSERDRDRDSYYRPSKRR
ncbi:hypothetical protein GGI12_003981 [Dipsacomyces acuminosporus]|nr:hypothetical protein GGI12_003981 [Dipsacomyces acuminosporus]